MTDLTALFTDLVRLETRLYNVLDARLKAEHDLPLGQFEFLRFLAGRGTARVHDLAHQMAITVGATSKAVDRLEAAGRCRRTANPDDRRSSLVTVTPEGERVLAAATPTVEAELQTWIGSVLPAEVLENLAVSLSMLRQRAEADLRTDRQETGRPGHHNARITRQPTL
ncbi:MarR family transcriptional regulator [Kribbella turkmenica]|uniref:MarR family transcriptional regulator n=1 Tax=Kribbella turkmenica TaxID=2530375 RepID=A0A4R4WD27_9ACTN|nr:MarR family winged helix-turn-helix transcriptional regulator [Kribbella turkmenica]TDD16789.1 MarR family transcriptional regulator [Kribbella turkmenica]